MPGRIPRRLGPWPLERPKALKTGTLTSSPAFGGGVPFGLGPQSPMRRWGAEPWNTFDNL